MVFVVMILIAIAAVSTASIFIKLCDAPALVIAAYRVVIASLVLAPFAIRRQFWRGLGRSEISWLVLSGIFLSLHFAFWIASLKFTSVASSVVLVSTHPLFVGLGAWLFLGERPGWNLLLGIALSVIGSGLISYGDLALSGKALTGDGLALLGAIMGSGYLLVGRRMRKGQGLLSYVFPVYSTAGVMVILFCLIFREPFFGYSSSTYVFLFLLALIPQLIGHTTFNWALKYLPASLVAVTILGEPVGSTILAYLVLGEGLTPLKMIGGAIILSGILISAWHSKGETREA